MQPSAETVAGVATTRLTLPILDGTVGAMLSIRDDSLDRSLPDGKGVAARIRTLSACAVVLLGTPTPSLHL
jgi:hypothetical protein